MTTMARNSWLHASASRRGFVRVPLTRGVAGTMYVPGDIEGTTVRLLVDTGASLTFLDEAAAGRLGVVRGNERRAGGCGAGAGGAVSVRFTEVASLGVGALQVGPTEMGIMDLGAVMEKLDAIGDGAADGVLGADFLIRHRAIVDVSGESLYLTSAGAAPDGPGTLPPDGAAAVSEMGGPESD